MANNYFSNAEPTERFIEGETARGSDVDEKLDAVASGFDGVQVDIKRAIKMPSGANIEISGFVYDRANKVLGFDASGNLELQTGVGLWRNTWQAATDYELRDYFQDPVTQNYYIAQKYHTSTTIEADLSAGKIALFIDFALLLKSKYIPLTFATVADLKAATWVQVGQVVAVEEYHAGLGGGRLFGKIVAGGTGTDDGGSYIDLPTSGLQFEQNFPSVISVKQFGAKGDGVTDDTDPLENAAAYAKPLGKSVFIPSSDGQYLLESLPNMNGVAIVGETGAAVDGYFENPGIIQNLKYGSASVGQTDIKSPRNCQVPQGGNDNKFLVQFASNQDIWCVFEQSEFRDDRDVMIVMRRGNGGDEAPWDHIRSQQVYFGQGFALQGFSGATESGTWTDFSATPLQALYPSGWGASFAGYNVFIVSKLSATNGDYIERTVTANKDGKVRCSFLPSAIGASFSITVNGSVVKTGTTKVSVSGPRFRHIDVDSGVFDDEVTVRITHTGITGEKLNFAGWNLHRPKETDDKIDYDKFGMYYDSDADYSGSVGAGDYAISNEALGFFGSYHGHEEKLQDPIWRVNGEEIPVAGFVAEKPYVGKTIDLFEKTKLGSASGGSVTTPLINTEIYQRFDGNGRHHINITLSGAGGVPFEVKKLYLGMNGTYDAFTRVFFPFYAEGVSGTENPDLLCGLTNVVAQENPTTGQVVYTYCNIESGYASGKGGVFVKTLDETGTNYQKVYYAWVYDSPTLIDKISAQIVKIFS